MPPDVFETGERPNNHALDRAAPVIGNGISSPIELDSRAVILYNADRSN